MLPPALHIYNQRAADKRAALSAAGLEVPLPKDGPGPSAVINILLTAGIIALSHYVFSLPPCTNWLLGALQSFKENALKNKTEEAHVKLGNEHALLATLRK